MRLRLAALLFMAAAGTGGCRDFGRLPPAPGLFSDAGTDAEEGTDSGPPTDAGPPIIPCPPTPDFDAGRPTFANDIAPIFNNCLGLCHGTTAASAGLVLAPGVAYANLVGVPASETAGTSMMSRVEPFDAEASYLVHKVQGSHLDPPAFGVGSRMPLGSPYCLPGPWIATLRAWVDRGANDD